MSTFSLSQHLIEDTLCRQRIAGFPSSFLSLDMKSIHSTAVVARPHPRFRQCDTSLLHPTHFAFIFIVRDVQRCMISLLSHIVQSSPVPYSVDSDIVFYILQSRLWASGSCSRGAGTEPEPGRSSLSSNMLLSLLYLSSVDSPHPPLSTGNRSSGVSGI